MHGWAVGGCVTGFRQMWASRQGKTCTEPVPASQPHSAAHMGAVLDTVDHLPAVADLQVGRGAGRCQAGVTRTDGRRPQGCGQH